MANKQSKNNITDERIEDVTLYGDGVPSIHQWMTLDRQRKVARHLEEVTQEIAPGMKEKNKKDKKRSD